MSADDYGLFPHGGWWLLLATAIETKWLWVGWMKGVIVGLSVLVEVASVIGLTTSTGNRVEDKRMMDADVEMQGKH